MPSSTSKSPTKFESPPPAKKSKIDTIVKHFDCELCGISTTSQQMLENHKAGSKHVKKLRTKEMNMQIGTTLVDGEVQYSANRTPSGLFYCNTCDMTVQSDQQLQQHFQSKKHARNMKTKPI